MFSLICLHIRWHYVLLYMDAFHNLVFFCVINLKDYTRFNSCFLSLGKSEPLLGRDQVLFVLCLQGLLAQCLEYIYSLSLFLFKLHLPQSDTILLRHILLMCLSLISLNVAETGKTSFILEAKCFELICNILFW